MAVHTFWRSFKKLFTSKPDYAVKPAGLEWRSSSLFIIATVGVGMFTDLFLYAITVPILPFILQDRLGQPYSAVQRNTSALLAIFAASSVVFCPIAGVVSDKLNSRRGPFLAGLLALMVSTILLLTGTNMAVFVVARLCQGASSAFVWTVGLSLAVDTVGQKNLGKTIGSLFSFISFGELFAPPIGGILYKKSGTLSILALSLSLLVVDFVMRIIVIEKSTAAKYHAAEAEQSSERPGLEAPSVADNATNDANETTDPEQPSETSPLLQETSQTNATGADADEEDTTYLVTGKQSAIVTAAPILYPLLHSPALATANFITFTQAFLLAAYDVTVPTHASELYGYDSLQVGLLFVPLSIMALICGPLGGWAVDRYGTKFGAVLGFAWLVPVLVLLRLPKAHPYPQQVVLWAVLLGLLGPGNSLGGGSPAIVEAGVVLERYHKRNPDFFGANGPYAQLYGVQSMVFNLGLAIGPVVAGELKDSIGYGNMNAFLAGLAALASIASLIWLGGPPGLWFQKRKNV